MCMYMTIELHLLVASYKCNVVFGKYAGYI